MVVSTLGVGSSSLHLPLMEASQVDLGEASLADMVVVFLAGLNSSSDFNEEWAGFPESW